jgi:hypothetical protein
MSLLFICDPTTYANNGTYNQPISIERLSTTLGYFISTYGSCLAGGRRGGLAIRYQNSYYNGYHGDFKNFGNLTGAVFGAALYVSPDLGNSAFFAILNSAGGLQFCVDCTAAGRMRVKTSPTGTVLAESSDGVFNPNTYQYWEIKFTCTGSDSVEIRIDGVSVLTGSSLNLRQSLVGGADTFRTSGVGLTSGNTLWCDIYIEDLSGSSFNDFLGDVKVDFLMPTSDGDYKDFAPSTGLNHYATIDERGLSTADYNEAAVVGDKDSYHITPTGDSPTIYAISCNAICANPDTGVAEITPFIRMSGVDYVESDGIYDVGATVEEFGYIITKRPDTGGVWSKTILSTNFEFGYEFSNAS